MGGSQFFLDALQTPTTCSGLDSFSRSTNFLTDFCSRQLVRSSAFRQVSSFPFRYFSFRLTFLQVSQRGSCGRWYLVLRSKTSHYMPSPGAFSLLFKLPRFHSFFANRFELSVQLVAVH